MPIERVKWSELEPEFISTWGRPNGKVESEHISIVGPTGSGKTRFQANMLEKRNAMRGSHSMVIATKPADATLRSMKWPIVRKYPPPYGKHEKFILWPQTDRDPQKAQLLQQYWIHEALTDIWVEGANTVVAFDEIAYVEQELNMRKLITRYWREARSLGITIVATTQRPRNVTRYMWSEPTWLIAFRPDDEDEARRVAEIIGGRKRFTDPLLELEEYEFIITKRRAKEAYISKLPK